MAEAHQAVAFSFQITHEGVNVDFDWEVLRLVWRSGLRSWKKRLNRLKNSIKNGVYPAPLSSLLLFMSANSALFYWGGCDALGLSALVTKWIPSIEGVPSFVLSSTALWSLTIFGVRNVLKCLLKYQGWMYEMRRPGGMSTLSKLWTLCVKLLSGFQPMLYSFQGSLPCLPVPGLNDTMTRYLRSVRPLYNDDEYKKMEELATEFSKGIGKKLQRYLILKSWWSSNYVSDWWEEYVYLRGRAPIMVNSNFYGMDAILAQPTTHQAARAANVIYSALVFRRMIERQALAPIIINGVVPLCSWQYERLFNTTRIPGVQCDRIQHVNDTDHIVVYHNGRYFCVTVYHKGRLLKPCEIEIQMELILQDNSEPAKGEAMLAALTAAERVPWAEARKKYFTSGINKLSLDMIEKSAFVVTLATKSLEYDKNDSTKLDQYGQSLLHGYDKWYDKSFTLVVGTNGKIGFNAEHSWADAGIMSHLWEYILVQDFSSLVGGYRPDGHTKGEADLDPPLPVRLKWNLTPDCIGVIEQSNQVAQTLASDVDLRLLMFSQYGKRIMKKCKVSPDAYIQMALQLAYFRDAGKFNLTYEASMTRMFREGRTETVRPCTVESCTFVKAMEDKNIPVEEKMTQLRKACAVHQRSYQDAMCGKGVDRHLFCLYVVSKYLEVDSPFLNEVLSQPWRLSTSQTPHGQTPLLDLNKSPNCISSGGGFGPVADDGYGVSYIIAGEDLLFFHVSSKKSSEQTNSVRFMKHIERALLDMRNLLQ